MSVYSMTGYANATAGARGAAENGTLSEPATTRSTGAGAASSAPASAAAAGVSVELRSVNSRFLDIVMRMPDELRSLEPALRELLSAAFRRGKIELRIATRAESDGAWPQPQPEQLMRLSRIEGTVHGWMPKAAPLSVHEVMQWCKGAGTTERLDEPALEAARRAITGLREAREREGARLAEVLGERLGQLRELAARAEPLVPAAVARQQKKFVERWEDALAASGAANTLSREALQERALNEAAAYAIRIDVAEELARLRAHLDELGRLLKAGGEVGKRLDFLIQELLREANTMGSKASTLELTNVSVEMKVVIEQLREQVQNLE